VQEQNHLIQQITTTTLTAKAQGGFCTGAEVVDNHPICPLLPALCPRPLIYFRFLFVFHQWLSNFIILLQVSFNRLATKEDEDKNHALADTGIFILYHSG
jgi:hypothetical protein